jgi:hypothetical protein
MKSYKVLLIGILISATIFTAAFALYAFILKSPTVIVQSSPESATVLINKIEQPSHRLTLKPGSYDLTVSFTGYVTYQGSITLKRGQKLVLPILLKQVPTATLLTTNLNTVPQFFDATHDVYFMGTNNTTLYRTRNLVGEAGVKVEAMTSNTLLGAEKVAVRPDGEVALIKMSDGIYLYDFKRYDFLNQSKTLWGTNIDDFAWSPNNLQVAYTYYGANGEQSLMLSDIQNNNQRREIDLTKDKIDHPSIAWSDDSRHLLLVAKSTQTKTNYIYTYDLFIKKFAQLTEVGEVEGAKWSPDGEYIAYVAPGRDSAGSTTNIAWIAKSDGSGVTPLNVAVSSISKLCWENNSTGVIVASNNTDGSIKLQSVDLSANITPYQYAPPTKFNPDNIMSIPKDSRLLFTNDGQLMSLGLITSKY